MSAVEPASMRACPKCEAVNAEHAVIQGEYRCTSCGFELAHLDIAANGAVRGVFGWLRAAGDTIQDRYRVRSVLGKGGFGATYLVDDLRLNGKRRALKEVPEILFDEYETALLSRLQHPSIPDIIDRFTAGGMVYLTLEFGGSRTLASERNRQGGRIPFVTLLPWMRQLCMVLTYLHTQDPPIIHRDLKPENILLDEDGRIMLIDFGIAKEATSSAMTRTLGRAATHGFSPPEQVMGTGTDQRSDVYALGATCYALVTGESPPAAHERVAGKELRPPGELSPEIPEEFGAALVQALSLNVNHRQQSVGEFSRMIEGPDTSTAAARTAAASVRTTMVGKVPSRPTAKPKSIRIPTAGTTGPRSSTVAPSPGAAPNRMGMAIGIGAAVIIAIAGGGYYFWSGSEPSETPAPAQTAIAPPAPAPSSPPATTPSVPVPAPAPPTSGAEAVQPQAATPPLAGQAPLGGESAQSILNNYTGGSPETSPPAAVTPDAPVSAAVQAPVRSSPPPLPTPGAGGPSAGGILDDNRGGVTQQPQKTPSRIAGAGTGTRPRTQKPKSSQPATAPKPRSSQPATAPKPAPVWKFDE
ncbi:MAG: protein kinase [Pseudomonadota bacterium]|nr:protein kinase [Gammaproteobacteria bacterium]MDQ3582900.1 protein kinase [Pseudomonadota bacterium]